MSRTKYKCLNRWPKACS